MCTRSSEKDPIQNHLVRVVREPFTVTGLEPDPQLYWGKTGEDY